MKESSKKKIKLFLIGTGIYTVLLFVAGYLFSDVLKNSDLSIKKMIFLSVMSFISFIIVHLYDRKHDRVLVKENLPNPN